MTTTTSLLKLPTPPPHHHHQFSSSPKLIPISIPISSSISSHTSRTHHQYNNKRIVSHAASSTSNNTPTPTPVITDDNQDQGLPPGACKSCGKLEIERNCNGEGRIQGGIATVPGFGWWPIKAYRPCPGFVASGGRYRRQGQSMDEVAGLGREGSRPKQTTVKAQSSKNKNGARKSKS